MTIPGFSGEGASPGSLVATAILANADRDVAFILRLTGASLEVLTRHFQSFIEGELQRCGVAYGDHPLLRLFVETHARELSDFVVSGIGLTHQFGLETFERLGGDRMRLLRTDLWDTLRSHIEAAERHFVSGLGGLRDILAEVEALRRGSPPESAE